MVFGHIPYDEIPNNDSRASSTKRVAPELESRLASPTDRVAAFIADLVILVPLITLIASPFRRQALEAQLLENSEGWATAYFLGIGASLLAYLAYQTIFLTLWGATPGKRAIGIRVEPLWEDRRKPRALAAFMRSFAICLEALCLGLPWVAVFGNVRRRPFHDRVGDTVVVAVRTNRAAGPPTVAEVSMASGVVAASLFVFAFLLSVQLVRLKSGMDAEALIADLEETGGLCAPVGDAYRKWIPPSGEEKPTRVSVALTLFQAEEIDDECLREEAEFSLWGSTDKATGYLARGLSESNDSDVAEEYFEKVCTTEPDSDACKAVTILDTPEVSEDPIEAKTAESDRENVLDAMASSLDSSSAPYLRVLFVKHFESQRRDERVLDMLEALPPHRALAYFVSSERSRALWKLDRKTEARLAMRATTEVAEPAQRVEVTRWFCDNETMSSGCSTEAKAACDLLGAVVDQNEVFLGEAGTAVTYLRGESCSERLTEERLSDLEKKFSNDEDAKSYVKALSSLKKDEILEATRLLREIASGENKSGPFFIEANARLTELASSADELKGVRDAWSQSDPTQAGWGFLGRRLMERYNALKAYSETVSVGTKLAENDGIDRLAARPMIVATYRSGQVGRTLSYLEKLGQVPTLESLTRDRAPASDPDSFNEVLFEILSKDQSRERAK
ncbi:MAG: RDD family protein [Bdellovibrionota bacterium]